MTVVRVSLWLILIWIADIIMWAMYVYITQWHYGKVRNGLECSLFYITEPALAIFVGVPVIFVPVLITALIYVLIFQIAKKSGVIDSSVKRKKKAKRGTSKSSVSYIDSNYDSNQTADIVTRGIDSREDNQSTTNGSASESKNKSKNRTKNKDGRGNREKKALQTIALLLVTFAMCWLPLAFAFTVAGIDLSLTTIDWFIIAYWFGYANSMLNPLCYAIGSPYFRETFIKVLCKCRT